MQNQDGRERGGKDHTSLQGEGSLRHQQTANGDGPVLWHSSVGDMLLSVAAASPDRTFALSPSDEIGELTYEEFCRNVTMMRGMLSAVPSLTGVHISFVMRNSLEFLVLYFAALSLGAVVVPANPDLVPREIAYVIEDSDAKIVFYDISLREKIGLVKTLAPHGIMYVCPNNVTDKAIAESCFGQDVEEPDDEAVVIYTSGTTGNPKGAMLSHRNLLSDACALADWFGFSEDTRTLCMLPLFHNNGQVVTLLAPLSAGGSVVVSDAKTAIPAFWGLEEKYGITWTSVMPSILSMLLAMPRERRGNTLEGIICGGQPLLRGVQEGFEKRFGIPIFEGYGLTETTSFACFNDFPAEKRRWGSVGRPLPVNDMAILGEDGRELGPNREGEICIRGTNVTAGYLGLPERNAEVFRDGWFHSGDFGHKDGDGYYYFGSRRDALIIRGGENIYPAELENVFSCHPDVVECAVVGVPDEILGENVCAFVVLAEGSDATSRGLRDYCRGKIAEFKQPKYVVVVNELDDLAEIPKGPTKKVLYKELRDYFVDRRGDGRNTA